VWDIRKKLAFRPPRNTRVDLIEGLLNLACFPDCLNNRLFSL